MPTGHRDPRMRSAPRKRLLKALRATGGACWVCGKPIDYGAGRTDPASFTGDELVPRSRGGDPLDPANVRPAHLGCNSRRGGRLAARDRADRASRAAGGPAVAPPQDRDAW